MTCPDCNSKIDNLKEIAQRLRNDFPSQFYPTKEAVEDDVNNAIKKGELLCNSCGEKSEWKVERLITRANLGDKEAQHLVNLMMKGIEDHRKKYV